MFNFEYAAFMRHGEAQNNEAERLYKAGDLSAYDKKVKRPSAFHSLTKLGEQQAIRAGEWLLKYSITFKHHLSSTHVRATQTASLLGICGAQWDVDDRLGEKDSGVFHEMTPDEADAYRARLKSRKREIDPYRFRPEGGHSFFDTEMIARSAVESLKDRTLAVCHGHFITVVDHVIMGGENSWDMGTWEDKQWQELPNCTFIEYSRRSPTTGHISDTRWWRRMSLPCEDRLGEWKEIVRPRYSNEDLLALVNKVLSRL